MICGRERMPDWTPRGVYLKGTKGHAFGRPALGQSVEVPPDELGVMQCLWGEL
jgi:hypothetical protein